MIDEIINFEKALKKSGDLKQIVKPEGLYIYVSFDEENNVKSNTGIYPIPENNHFIQENNHFEDCFQRNQYVNGFSNANSRFDGFKTNSSSCAYSIIVTKVNYINLIENGNWDASINNFFSKAINYIDNKNNVENFKQFLICRLKDEIELFEKRISNYNDGKTNAKEKIKEFKTLFVFLDISVKEYKASWDTFNQKAAKASSESSYFQNNELINFDISRKEFLAHHTATFIESYKVSSELQGYIKSFFNSLKSKNIFPKPLPIFIDKKELNRKVISIYENDKKLAFADIFERIYAKEEGIEDSDLQNYYLLYAQVENKKFIIKDFEFVPSFNYKLDYEMKPVFDGFNKFPEAIDHIFEFQRIIIRELFDNCLFKKDDKTGAVTNNYWGEVNAKSCKSNNNYRLILQYRKAFYDFVYKSKRQALTGNMIKEIILSSVIDALQDEKYRNKNPAKEERIKSLLTIYFNLNQHFDTNNSNFNKINISMATKTKELLAYAKELVSNDEKHFEENEDMEFAFCFGQLVYYLLSQSEASKKTHSLLLAYLQKSDFDLLKQKAKEDTTKYSYKISFNNRKFNKMSSEVFGDTPKTNFADLISFFLAGYFSKNVIY